MAAAAEGGTEAEEEEEARPGEFYISIYVICGINTNSWKRSHCVSIDNRIIHDFL